MPHPVYGNPDHRLEVIRATYVLPSLLNGHTALLSVIGDTSTSRKALWSYKEAWAGDEQRQSLEPLGTLHQIVLAAAQDRPDTQAHFERCVLPGGWEDVPLPY